jgi:hypothetical protein
MLHDCYEETLAYAAYEAQVLTDHARAQEAASYDPNQDAVPVTDHDVTLILTT